MSDGTKADETKYKELEELLPSKEEALDYLIDICIIYYSLLCYSAFNLPPHKFPSKQKDSLRRHLIDFYLACVYEGISYT